MDKDLYCEVIPGLDDTKLRPTVDVIHPGHHVSGVSSRCQVVGARFQVQGGRSKDPCVRWQEQGVRWQDPCVRWQEQGVRWQVPGNAAYSRLY